MAATGEAVKRFVNTLLGSGVLLRGHFTLKNGSTSTYFVDFGHLETAEAVDELGAAYADAIITRVGVQNFDVIFGPAYKGIPIALGAAMGLRARGYDKPFSFNRKEEKGHGEGGLFIGHQPRAGERILIVDDVITDGGTKVEMIDLLRDNTEATVVGVVVGVDRSEPGTVERFEQETGVRLWSIAGIADVTGTS